MALQIFTVQTAPPLIWFHVACAATSIILGAWLLYQTKGSVLHRCLGRLWVILMLCTSISSFQIQAKGHLSEIHLLSIVTMVGVTAAVMGAYKRNLVLHRISMICTYSGLVTAGLFTLLPYRMLGQFVFGTR